MIHGNCNVKFMENDPHTGKPYLRLEFPDGMTIEITTNLAEMIGGCGKGARERYEDDANIHRPV